MKYLILDDEPIAHQVIQGMCANLPFMELQGNCYNAMEVLDVLNNQWVDLIFLDIHLPKLDGFEFLRTLKRAPHVIVISADREYALEGYDLNISDYLLKPFSFERFLRAVNKVRARLEGQPPGASTERYETLFLKDGKKHHQVTFDDIVFIEACGNYCLVHLDQGRILTQEKISDLANRLPDAFIRIHKSYIVASRKIRVIAGNEVKVGNKTVPVGRVFKSAVAKLIKQQS